MSVCERSHKIQHPNTTDVLLLATQRWEKPNITDMADTAIVGSTT